MAKGPRLVGLGVLGIAVLAAFWFGPGRDEDRDGMPTEPHVALGEGGSATVGFDVNANAASLAAEDARGEETETVRERVPALANRGADAPFVQEAASRTEGESVGGAVEAKFRANATRYTGPCLLEVLLASTALPGFPKTMASNDGLRVSLAPGSYEARLIHPELGAGPSVDFEVAASPVRIALDLPYAFNVRLALKDESSGERILDSHASLAERNGNSSATLKTTGASSDEFGYIELVDVIPGDWDFQAGSENYADLKMWFTLPSQYEAAAREEGVIDFGELAIRKLKPVSFELQGAEDWLDLRKFKIAHTHSGVPEPFDKEGRATLQIGYHGTPLYLKLWYPDGRECIFYVLGKLPAPGAFHPIKVAGERELEVQLRLSQDASEALTDKDCWVRASFLTSGVPEEKSVAIPFNEEGTYAFQSIQADEAVISVVTTGDGGTVDWATKKVRLRPQGITPAELHVTQQPATLSFLNADGEPAEGVEFRVYQLPNTTGWVGNGITDKAGEAAVASVDDSDCVIIADDPTRLKMLIDVPIDLHSSTESAALTIGEGADTFVHVTCEGAPMANIQLGIHGAKSGIRFTALVTGDNGETSRIKLHRSSSALLGLESDGYWMPRKRLPLETGRTDLRVWKTAVLVANHPDALQALYSVDFETEVSNWMNEFLVTMKSEGDQHSITLPAGRYLAPAPDGSSTEIHLEAGATQELFR